MEYLPPVVWDDVARRHDLDVLRAELGKEVSDLRAEMKEAFSPQLVWLVSTVLGAAGLVMAVVGWLVSAS